MSSLAQERIGIVGLGAIGGSLALSLRDHASLIAWSRDPGDRASAAAARVRVPEGDGDSWLSDFANATIVVVAVPLDEVASVARGLLHIVPNDALLLHTGSLQRRDAVGLDDAESRRVLGTHPIAGSERSGFAAATGSMFRGAALRAEARATDAERRRIEALWGAAGIERIIWSDAEAHDDLMSWVSHLPQLTATAVAATLAHKGIASRDAGPGVRDLTRLASSDLTMWKSILSKTSRETPTALRRLTAVLESIASAIEAKDDRLLAAHWDEARRWRLGLAETQT
jgi:prephenate dehydrogenase